MEIDEEKRLQAGLTTYLCQMWRAFEQSDDHLRYFGGELVLQPERSFTDHKNRTHTVDVLQFRLDQETNLIDQIAQERLNRAKFGL